MAEWLTILTIGLLAVMIPGPNLAITMRNTIIGSRSAGIRTAAGLATGNLIHATYSLIGIGFIISQSVLIFNIMKWAGAIFLIILGFKMLRSKPQESGLSTTTDCEAKGDKEQGFAAFRSGLLTNLLNPKVALFFLALFTQLIHPGTSAGTQALYGLTMVGLEFIWFSSIAIFLSLKKIKNAIRSSMRWVENVTGVVLIVLGIRLAFTEQN